MPREARVRHGSMGLAAAYAAVARDTPISMDAYNMIYDMRINTSVAVENATLHGYASSIRPWIVDEDPRVYVHSVRLINLINKEN